MDVDTGQFQALTEQLPELETRLGKLEHMLDALYRGIEIVGQAMGQEIVPPRPRHLHPVK